MLMEKLNVNELRMQSIEVKHRQLLKFEAEFKQFKESFNRSMKVVETFREIPKIIERTIPMVTHF